jgi:hypothetical protein
VDRVLTRRELNRALLARQLLLERVAMPALGAVEHLVGMQAQAPLAPYVALWSRLAGFDPAELATLIEERRAVRAVSMLRTTIHLVSDRDALALRPVVQAVAETGFRTGSPFARQLLGINVQELLVAGRAILEERPLAPAALGKALAIRWPDRDPTSLSMAVRYLVPTVQVPPRGIWGRSGPPALATLESWLGRPLEADATVDPFVLRYLAAFGPASTQDIAAWSWLRGLPAVVDRLRPRLRVFRDEHGRELFDVPDGSLPDPETPAPPRFLPEYDNVLLSHRDRTRITDRDRKVPWPAGNGGTMGTFLVDGFTAGTWRIRRDGGVATLTNEPWAPLSVPDQTALEVEGRALLGFVADRETPTVEFSQREPI